MEVKKAGFGSWLLPLELKGVYRPKTRTTITMGIPMATVITTMDIPMIITMLTITGITITLMTMTTITTMDKG